MVAGSVWLEKLLEYSGSRQIIQPMRVGAPFLGDQMKRKRDDVREKYVKHIIRAPICSRQISALKL
ncbi:hypothetical protein J2782_002813 [Brucella pseudogrignonensis]|uniref:Uncharacterized protein n=1 Tax=Brucella pseudogrignonensis TaxID=419475 RepID=A0ABU1MAK9_9HYPH|nr:hypothetical protein [Brucella pseudogrignonensis]